MQNYLVMKMLLWDLLQLLPTFDLLLESEEDDKLMISLLLLSFLLLSVMIDLSFCACIDFFGRPGLLNLLYLFRPLFL